MNVHHLELFYYVAKHGGISAAVRHIPYGIQQPAVSGQIAALEEAVGARLFERSPFRLTSAGTRLFAHARPFFENLAPLARDLRGVTRPELRLGGAEIILRDHLSGALRPLRARHARLRLALRAGDQAQAEAWVRDGEIDLAVTSLGARPPARLRQLRLTRIPLALVVRRGVPWKSAEEVLARKNLPEPLVTHLAETSFVRDFERELKRRRIAWPVAVEATSTDIVARHVADGAGIGLTNLGALAGVKLRDVRVLPLTGFPPLVIGVLWRGELTPLQREALADIQGYCRTTFPDWACSEQPA